MPASGSSQYLIAVTLQKTQAFADLVKEIERVRTAAAKGASFKVGLDASALQGIEQQIATAVQKGFAKVGGISLEGQVAEAVERGTKKGKQKAATKQDNAADHAYLRELEKKLTAIKSAGKLEIDTKRLDNAFSKIAKDFAEHLQGYLKNLKVLDFDQIMRASAKWREALGAGLQGPFMSGRQGALEAASVLRSPESSPAARRLAQQRVLEWQKEIDNDRVLSAAKKRRAQQEDVLAKLSDEDIRRRRELLNRSTPGGKDIKPGSEPAVLIRGREVSLVAAQEAQKRLKEAEDVLKLLSERRGSRPVHWQRMPDGGAQIRQASMLERLTPLRSNAVLGEVMRGVTGPGAAKNALIQLAVLEQELRQELAIARRLGPKKMPPVPTAAPWDIIAGVDAHDLEALVSGGKSMAEKGSQQAKAARRFQQMRKFEAAGGTFTPYGSYEQALLRQEMAGAQRAGLPGRVTQLSRQSQQGGEWYMGSFQGYRQLTGLVGEAQLRSGELPSAPLRARGARGAGGADAMQQSLAELQHVDFGKIAQGFHILASSTDVLEAALKRVSPELKSGRNLSELAKVISADRKKAVAELQTRQAEIKLDREGDFYSRERSDWAKRNVAHERTADRAKQRRTEEEQKAAEKQDFEAAKQRNRLELLERKRDLQTQRVMNLAQASGGGPTNLLRAMGGTPGMGMSDTQMLAALGTNISGTMRQQQRIKETDFRLATARRQNLPTGGLETQALRLGTGLDYKNLQFLEMLGHAGAMAQMPGSTIPADIAAHSTGALSDWRQLQRKREIIEPNLARMAAARGLGPAEFAAGSYTGGGGAAIATAGPYGPKLPPSMMDAVRATNTITRMYGGEDQAVRRNAQIREEQQKIVNLAKERVNKQLESHRLMDKEKGYVDFVSNKLKSLATYAGVGFVLYRITGSIGAALRDVVQLEEALGALRAILPNASLNDMLEIRTGVVKAAREFGQQIEVAARSAREFAQMGMAPGEIVKETRAVMAAMTGMGISSEQAVNLAVSTSEMTGGRVVGSDIFDRMAAVRRRHPVPVEGLASVVERSGALAMSLQPDRMGGVDAFDVIIGAQTRILEKMKGIGPAAAASTVGYMLSKLTTPQTQKQLQQQFGIQMGTGKGGETRSFSDIMSDVAKYYKAHEGTAAGQNLLATLAGPRQGRQLVTLFENWDAVMKIAQESANSMGESSKQAAIQMDTLGFQMRAMGSALRQYMDQLLNSIGVLGGTHGILPMINKGIGMAAENPVKSTLAGLAGATIVSYGAGKLFTLVGRGFSGAGTGIAGGLARALPSLAGAAPGFTAAAGTGLGAAVGGIGTSFGKLGGLFASSLMGYLGVITAVVAAVIAMLWIGKKMFGGPASSGDSEARHAAEEKYGEEAAKYNRSPKVFGGQVRGIMNVARTRMIGRYGAGIFGSGRSATTDRSAYAFSEDEISRLAAEQGFVLPKDKDERSQAIGEWVRQEIARTEREPLTKQKRTSIYGSINARVGLRGIVGYRETPAGELTDMGKYRVQLKQFQEMQLRPENRPSGALPTQLSGSLPFRDRLLEALVSYGVSRREAEGMKGLGGTVGFDYPEARRRAARGLVEGVNKAFAETEADVIRAREALMQRQLAEGVDESAGYVDSEGRFQDAKDVKQTVQGGQTQKTLSLQLRLDMAKKALRAVNDDQTLMSELPSKYKTEIVRMLGVKSLKSDKEALAFFKEYLTLASGVKELTRAEADEAERIVVARDKGVKLLENERDLAMATLEFQQRRTQLGRQVGISRAEMQGAGAGLSPRLRDALARGVEEVAKIRREGEFDRRQIELTRGLKSDRALELEKLVQKNNEDRRAIMADQNASIEAERIVVEARVDVERSRIQSARDMVHGATSGLRGALGQGLMQGFAGAPAGEIILKPLFAGLQQKLADKFIDSFFGPDGLFGPKLEKVFSVDTVMDTEILVRQRHVAMLEAAFAVEQEARMRGTIPKVGQIGERGGELAPLAPSAPNTGVRQYGGLPKVRSLGSADLLGRPGAASDIGGVPNFGVAPALSATAAALPLLKSLSAAQTELSALYEAIDFGGGPDVSMLGDGAEVPGMRGPTARRLGTRRMPIVGAAQNRAFKPGTATANLFRAGDRMIGTPFNLGGETPLVALDCSAFVREVFGKIGYNLPRTTEGLMSAGRGVKKWSDARAGDVLLFDAEDGDGKPDHSAIYAGKGRILHASSSGKGVRYDDLDSVYGRSLMSRLLSVRRVLPDEETGAGQSFHRDMPALNRYLGGDAHRLGPRWLMNPYGAERLTFGARAGGRGASSLSGISGSPAMAAALWGSVDTPDTTFADAEAQRALWARGWGDDPNAIADASKGMSAAAVRDAQRAERRKFAMQQAKLMLAQQGGILVGGALNSDRGLLGVRTGVNKGQNYANEGATLGAALGSVLPGVGTIVGTVIGSLAGGMLGGLLRKGRRNDTPEAQALERIDRSTRDTVTAIENQTRMLDLQNRLFNVPATFKYPSYPVFAGGGAPGMQGYTIEHVDIHVNGAQDPKGVADAVAEQLRDGLRTSGRYVSRIRP